MKITTAVLALCLTAVLSACSATTGSTDNSEHYVAGDGSTVILAPSERDPAITLAGKTLAGQNWNLADHKGHVVVVNVWASWCSPCRAEAPLLSDFSQKYRSQGVQFVGIVTRDNLSSALAFTKRFKLDYPSFTDDSLLAKFRDSLVPNAIPTTLIIDAHGYVAARISGEVTVALLRDLIDRVLKDPAHA